jgi:hypothetical protein
VIWFHPHNGPKILPAILILPRPIPDIPTPLLLLLGCLGHNQQALQIFRTLLGLALEAHSEPLSESSQSSSLVLLNISELLDTWVPQRVVADILGRTNNSLRTRRELLVGAAIGKNNDLVEEVWPLGTADQVRVTALNGGAERGEERRQGSSPSTEDRRERGHRGEVVG